MLNLTQNISIYLRCGITDLRKSFSGLALIVEDDLERNLLDGEVFLFCNKSRKLIKAVYWDGSGLCVFSKRLEGGCFCWPVSREKAKEITTAELSMLLEGLDNRETQHRFWYRRRPIKKAT